MTERTAVADAVVEVYGDSLGYQGAELALDAHLEGELGVDSLRQAELVTRLTDRFGLPAVVDLAELDALSTLDDVIGYLCRMLEERE